MAVSLLLLQWFHLRIAVWNSVLIHEDFFHHASSSPCRITENIGSYYSFFFFLAETLWNITVSHVKNALSQNIVVLLCPHWVTDTSFSWFSKSAQCDEKNYFSFLSGDWVLSCRWLVEFNILWLDILMDYQNWKRPEELFSSPLLHMRNSAPQLMNELSVKWNLSLLMPSFCCINWFFYSIDSGKRCWLKNVLWNNKLCFLTPRTMIHISLK